MCEYNSYESPYIYLLEFHIGDGYFDRLPNGDYSVLVNYRDNINVLIRERERGDDRLVKFRQGKSIMFGITPRDEMQVIFQAFDNNDEIGKSSLYFLGIGAPTVLANKSFHCPTASVIRTNLQLSRGAGSLQVFARLTCLGVNLVTDFCISNDENTEFDAYVDDIKLSAEASFAKCQFDIGKVLDVKEAGNSEHVIGKEREELLCNLMSNFHLTSDPLQISSVDTSYYKTEDITEEELINEATITEDREEYMQEILIDILEKICSPINAQAKQIHNLDDLMFKSFRPLDGSTSEENLPSGVSNTSLSDRGSINANQFLISAENSILSLLKSNDEFDHQVKEEIIEENSLEKLKKIDVCIEPQIGDAPLSATNNLDLKTVIKLVEGAEDNEVTKSDEIPYETGDAPISISIKAGKESALTEKIEGGNQGKKLEEVSNEIEDKLGELGPETMNKSSPTSGLKKRKHLPEDDEGSFEIEDVTSEEENEEININKDEKQIGIPRRQKGNRVFAKGRRRNKKK